NLTHQAVDLWRKLRGRWSCGVDHPGYGKAEAREIIRSCSKTTRGNVVEPARDGCCKKKRTFLVPAGFANRLVLPAWNLEPICDRQGFLPNRLAQAQGKAGRRIWYVLTQHQHRICLFGLL